MNMNDIDIIKGQEAICPDGLGRVVDWNFEHPFRWVRVRTYIDDRSGEWDWDNVELIDPRGEHTMNVLARGARKAREAREAEWKARAAEWNAREAREAEWEAAREAEWEAAREAAREAERAAREARDAARR